MTVRVPAALLQRLERLEATLGTAAPDASAPAVWTPPADARPRLGLEAFVREGWRLLEPAVPFVPGWHLSLLCEHLEALSRGDVHDLLINVPPGTTKSLTVGVFWPAWEWTWQPWMRWLTASYDARLALRDAVRTRRLMQSAWYRGLVTVPWAFESDQNVKGYYLNNRTGWRIAIPLVGAATGEHAHRVVVDDPHHVKKAESDAVREAALMEWRETYPSRVLPGGARVMVGQRTHEEDASADWLSREADVIHHLELQMELDLRDGGEDRTPCDLTGLPHDPRTRQGELLAPARFPPEKVARLRIDLGPYAYSAQYQQRPTPRAGMVLDPAWFVDRPAHALTVPYDIVMAWDLNYSERDESDWTVALTAAVERDAELPRIHLLDVFAEHLAETQHDRALADYIALWKPLLVGIEKRAFEKQGATQDLIRRIRIRLQGKHTAAIEPVEADTDKVARAQIIAGRAKAGLISVDRSAPWWTALSSEMSKFPKSAHDDRIDALAHLVRLAVEKLEQRRRWAVLAKNPHAAFDYGPAPAAKAPALPRLPAGFPAVDWASAPPKVRPAAPPPDPPKPALTGQELALALADAARRVRVLEAKFARR